MHYFHHKRPVRTFQKDKERVRQGKCPEEAERNDLFAEMLESRIACVCEDTARPEWIGVGGALVQGKHHTCNKWKRTEKANR